MHVDGVHRFSCNSISTSVERNPFFKHRYIIDSFINSISRRFFLIFVYGGFRVFLFNLLYFEKRLLSIGLNLRLFE